MHWIKKGLIYSPVGNYEWNFSHSQVPITEILNDKRWRIYYSSRDKMNRSYTSYIDVEAGNPQNIIFIHNKPIIGLGKSGTFDDSGIMPTCILSNNGTKYLFYIGWNVGVTVPYHNSIGLAICNGNDNHFEKLSEGPIIDKSIVDPYFTGTAFVLLENKVWKMWYLSCTKWEIINNKFEPFYHIKYAESLDGIDWKREGTVAIDYSGEKEGGICSASVIKEKGLYKMWYSYRYCTDYRNNPNASYRIGYAESINGIKWRRMDKAVGIGLSSDGWDSLMLAYPNVIVWNNKKYMFYNGNGFGKTGFGYAVLEE